MDFLRMACNARRKQLGQPELDPLEFYAFIMPKVSASDRSAEELMRALFMHVIVLSWGRLTWCFCSLSVQLDLLNMEPTFLNRNVNEGFSGGEKKRNEILQLAVLEVGEKQHTNKTVDQTV